MNNPSRCLDCGVLFSPDDPVFSIWFECSECGAMHVHWLGKWWLQDDADDQGRLMYWEIANSLSERK